MSKLSNKQKRLGDKTVKQLTARAIVNELSRLTGEFWDYNVESIGISFGIRDEEDTSAYEIIHLNQGDLHYLDTLTEIKEKYPEFWL